MPVVPPVEVVGVGMVPPVEVAGEGLGTDASCSCRGS